MHGHRPTARKRIGDWFLPVLVAAMLLGLASPLATNAQEEAGNPTEAPQATQGGDFGQDGLEPTATNTPTPVPTLPIDPTVTPMSEPTTVVVPTDPAPPPTATQPAQEPPTSTPAPPSPTANATEPEATVSPTSTVEASTEPTRGPTATVPPESISAFAIGEIVLIADGSSGPVAVVAGASVVLAVSGLGANAAYDIEGRVGDCNGALESSGSGTAFSSGTTSIEQTRTRNVRVGFAVSSGGVTSNCLVVDWTGPVALALTANGESGSIDVAPGAVVTLAATGLAPGAFYEVFEFFSPSCLGVARTLESGLAPPEGAFQAQRSFADQLRGYQTASGGVRSNCVVVRWNAGGPSRLTVAGDSGPITVATGTPVKITVIGVTPGVRPTIHIFEDDCTGPLVGRVNDFVFEAGAWQFTQSHSVPSTRAYLVLSNDGVSSCLVVTWADPVGTPVLRANGSTGLVTGLLDGSVHLDASGIAPGTETTLEVFSDDCGGAPIDSMTMPEVSAGVFQQAVSQATFATLAYQVVASGVASNCVIVTWGGGVPTLRIDGATVGVEVNAGAGFSLEASGVSPGASVSFEKGLGSCGDSRAEFRTRVASASGVAQTNEQLGAVGTYAFAAVSGGQLTNCVTVTVVQGPLLLATRGGETGPFTFTDFRSRFLDASGVAGDVQVTVTRHINDCSSPVLTSEQFVVNDDGGPFSVGLETWWNGTFAVRFYANGAVSNCVIYTWDIHGLPHLTINGSSGPLLEVPVGTELQLVASDVSPGQQVDYIGGKAECFGGGTLSSEVAGADGTTTFTYTVADPGRYSFVGLNTAFWFSNCVEVNAVEARSLSLTANGSTDPITVERGERVSLVASGLYQGRDVTVTTRDGNCAGPVVDTGSLAVPPSGTYRSTFTSPVSTTLAYEVASAGEISNCILVTWISTPVLSVDGSAGPISALVGESLAVSVAGVDPGAVVTLLQSASSCGQAAETAGAGAADGSGVFDASFAVETLGPIFLQAESNGVTSNCVEITGSQASFTLDANGSAGPLTVPAGTMVQFQASGVVAGSTSTLLWYAGADPASGARAFAQAEPCTGDPAGSEATTAVDDGTAAWENGEAGSASLAFQVEANGVRSNCVAVTWLAPPTSTSTTTALPTASPTESTTSPENTPAQTVPAETEPAGAVATVSGLPNTGADPGHGPGAALPLLLMATAMLGMAALAARKRSGP